MERNNKEKMSSTEKKRKRYSITINTPYKVAVIKALMKVMEMPVSKAKDLYDHAYPDISRPASTKQMWKVRNRFSDVPELI